MRRSEAAVRGELDMLRLVEFWSFGVLGIAVVFLLAAALPACGQGEARPVPAGIRSLAHFGGQPDERTLLTGQAAHDLAELRALAWAASYRATLPLDRWLPEPAAHQCRPGGRFGWRCTIYWRGVLPMVTPMELDCPVWAGPADCRRAKR